MNKQSAQRIYRDAWNTFRLTTDETIQDACKEAMDTIQPHCCESGRPDPEWEAFAESLPGYMEFWQSWAQDVRGRIQRTLD